MILLGSASIPSGVMFFIGHHQPSILQSPSYTKTFSSHCTVFYIPLLVFLLRPSAYIITPRFVYLLPLA